MKILKLIGISLKKSIMFSWAGKGLIDHLYDLILFFLLILICIGGNIQGLSNLFYTGILLVASLILLRGSGKVIKVNLVFISIILFCFVYGTEFYLTLYGKESLDISDRVKKGFDIRTRSEVYKDLRGKRKNPTLVVTPSILLKEEDVPELSNENIFPLAGISNRLTILCNETGRWSIYNSDEYGFNNPQGLYKTGLDILLVGDSFTHGYCVEQDQTIAAHLRKSYPFSISVGAGGNGELARLASLVEYGVLLRPKTVLWIYTENTSSRFWNEISNPILKNYLQVDGFRQGLTEKQVIVDRALENFLNRKIVAESRCRVVVGLEFGHFVRFGNFRKWLHSALNDFQTRIKPDSDITAENEIIQKILIKAKKTTESWGGKFIYVYLSTHATTKGSSSDHERMIKLSNDIGLDVIDSYSVIEKANPMEIYSYNGRGHYSAVGYQLFSKVILDSLQSNMAN